MSSESAEHQDYTKGPIGRAIISLAVPMVLEMSMESLFAVADVYFVGKLGADAVATIGLTESLLTLVYCVAMGLSIGAAAVTARRIGEGDDSGAAVATVQSLILGTLVSLAIAAGGLLCSESLLRMMGGNEALIGAGTTYCRIMLGTNFVVVLLFLGNAAFRGAGDAWIAMRALALANAANLILCPLLVNGVGTLIPPLGVTGAAWSTCLARGAGATYVLWSMLKGRGRLHIDRSHFQPSPAIMASIARLSAAGTFQMFIGMASWVGLVRVISNFGSTAVAGYTIGMRILVFALLPAYGLGNAAATMVGQSLGDKNPGRAMRSVWLAGGYGAVFLGVIGVLFYFGADLLVSQFVGAGEVHDGAVHCLRIVSCGYPFYAYGMIVSQAFNGAGDTWTPTWLNFGVFWLFEIPLAAYLSLYTPMGPSGVFYAITAGFSLLAVVSVLVFRRGRWQTQVL